MTITIVLKDKPRCGIFIFWLCRATYLHLFLSCYHLWK